MIGNVENIESKNKRKKDQKEYNFDLSSKALEQAQAEEESKQPRLPANAEINNKLSESIESSDFNEL